MRIYNNYLHYENYVIIFMPHKTSQAGKMANGGQGKSEKGKGEKEKGIAGKHDHTRKMLISMLKPERSNKSLNTIRKPLSWRYADESS